MKRTFVITYYFVPSTANGEYYTRSMIIRAKECTDETVKLLGFGNYGERFNDNCYHWTIKTR
jgi:hypothetical protein